MQDLHSIPYTGIHWKEAELNGDLLSRSKPKARGIAFRNTEIGWGG